MKSRFLKRPNIAMLASLPAAISLLMACDPSMDPGDRMNVDPPLVGGDVEEVYGEGKKMEEVKKRAVAQGVRKEVKWVVDGDTIKVCKGKTDRCSRKGQESIRIKGIECPESSSKPCKNKPDKKECYEQVPIGKKAKEVAKDRLRKGKKEGEMVTLVPTGKNGKFEKGGKGRRLAYVEMEDGKDFGLSMIEEGLCRNYDRYDHPREKQYQAAQKEAGVFKIKRKK